jgi:hypothetical protein
MQVLRAQSAVFALKIKDVGLWLSQATLIGSLQDLSFPLL